MLMVDVGLNDQVWKDFFINTHKKIRVEAFTPCTVSLLSFYDSTTALCSCIYLRNNRFLLFKHVSVTAEQRF